VAAGADFIAAIQGVWNHKDGPAAAVIAFNDAIKSALKDRMSLEAA
jgi:thiamine-phosphate pyrophosphorylase